MKVRQSRGAQSEEVPQQSHLQAKAIRTPENHFRHTQLTPMHGSQSEKHFLVHEHLYTFIRLSLIQEPKAEFSHSLLFL